jgi:hypothetical protein
VTIRKHKVEPESLGLAVSRARMLLFCVLAVLGLTGVALCLIPNDRQEVSSLSHAGRTKHTSVVPSRIRAAKTGSSDSHYRATLETATSINAPSPASLLEEESLSAENQQLNREVAAYRGQRAFVSFQEFVEQVLPQLVLDGEECWLAYRAEGLRARIDMDEFRIHLQHHVDSFFAGMAQEYNLASQRGLVPKDDVFEGEMSRTLESAQATRVKQNLYPYEEGTPEDLLYRSELARALKGRVDHVSDSLQCLPGNLKFRHLVLLVGQSLSEEPACVTRNPLPLQDPFRSALDDADEFLETSLEGRREEFWVSDADRGYAN